MKTTKKLTRSSHLAYHKKLWQIAHRLKWYDGYYWPYPDGMFDLITGIVSWDKDFSHEKGNTKGRKFHLRYREAHRTLKQDGHLLVKNSDKTTVRERNILEGYFE